MISAALHATPRLHECMAPVENRLPSTDRSCGHERRFGSRPGIRRFRRAARAVHRRAGAGRSRGCGAHRGARAADGATRSRRPARGRTQQARVRGGSDRRDAQRRGLLRRDLQPRHRQPRLSARLRPGRGLWDRRVHGLPRRRRGARPGHVSSAAVGGSHGLADLRRLLRERHSGAARRARAVAHPAGTAAGGRLRVHGRARGRALHHAARAPGDPVRRRGPGRTGAGARGRGLPARLPVPLRCEARRHRRHASRRFGTGSGKSVWHRARSRTSGGRVRSSSRSGRWRDLRRQMR